MTGFKIDVELHGKQHHDIYVTHSYLCFHSSTPSCVRIFIGSSIKPSRLGLMSVLSANIFLDVVKDGTQLILNIYIYFLYIYLRNEFHFSGVHGAMNRSGSRAK